MTRAAADIVDGCGRWVWLALVFLSGCNIQHYAVNRLGDAIATSSGSSFASDNDPELIRQAAPFSLKLTESLLLESPRHRGLLLTACSGFTQYSYAFVQQDADEMESRNVQAATAMRERARKLYLRARDYGLRGLDVGHKGFSPRLFADPDTAVAKAKKKDVPFLYWTAAAWGSAISVSKNRPELIADQPIVEALIDRALQLDESWDYGAIHTFLITYETVRQGAAGSAAARAREHFRRAVELSNGQLAAPYVALAEAVCIQDQNRSEFQELLGKALAIDVSARPEWRLANILATQRAMWLLSQTDELFVE